MGFFDFLFGGGSIENQIKKHAKRVKHKDAQQEDRLASIQWLADTATPEAIYALLGRFEMTYEHQMKDAQEKELVDDLILLLGAKALPALETFTSRTKSFARPLALYQRLAGQERALALVLSMLEKEASQSEFKPQKKKNLLVKLADFQGESIPGAVIPLLDDFDDGVRYAAIEVLFAQTPSDAIRDALIARMAHEEEDSNRLKVRIAEVAVSRGWTLGEHAEAVAAAPPQGWSVVGERLRQG